MKIHPCLASAGVLFCAGSAQATDVTFSGSLVSSCVLSLSTPGLLAASADGTTLGSENAGGSAATLSVVAIGASPSVQFGAPQLTAPAALSGSPVTSLRWQSLSGKSQSYTTSSSTATGVGLVDAFTVNTKVDNAAGFASGNYTVRATVTCQQ